MPHAALLDRARNVPGAVKWTYLDTSSTGLLPRPTRTAIEAFLDSWMDDAKDKAAWDAAFAEARSRFAALINADAGDVAYVKNTTEGANLIATSMQWSPGDEVVVCGLFEHPANLYPWLNLERQGVVVRKVEPTGLAIDPARLIEAIGPRTRAVAVSSVTFFPGFLVDLAPLAEACDRADAMLFIDATQSAGVLSHDVKAVPVGGLVSSTHKYLMGFYGQGMLYVRPDWAERLKPGTIGQHGTVDPDAHPSDDGSYAIRLAPGAKRFEAGQLPLGATALAASLAMAEAAGGKQAIEAHATALADRFARGLEALDLPVNRDPLGQPQTQIVTIGLPTAEGLYRISDPVLSAVHEALNAAGVKHSARRGGLRFSFHLYNDDVDVDRALEIAREAAGKARA